MFCSKLNLQGVAECFQKTLLACGFTSLKFPSNLLEYRLLRREAWPWCSPWHREELDRTWQLNNNYHELLWQPHSLIFYSHSFFFSVDILAFAYHATRLYLVLWVTCCLFQDNFIMSKHQPLVFVRTDLSGLCWHTLQWSKQFLPTLGKRHWTSSRAPSYTDWSREEHSALLHWRSFV